MKIIGAIGDTIVDSDGFYVDLDIPGSRIIDTRTGIVLGSYRSIGRTKAVFNEMKENFIRPNKPCYVMPKE